MGRLQAVTFDFWNTLVEDGGGEVRELRMRRLRGALDGIAAPLDDARLEAVLERAWKAFVHAWHTNEGQYGAADTTELILSDLGIEPTDEARERLLSAVLGHDEDLELRLTPNVAECLRELDGAGIRLGIVCDVGITPSPVLREQLGRHGLLELFDHWSFSDEVGVYKPDPRIFDHALRGLGDIEPRHAAHIGDLRRTDIAGARAFGMTAIRYSGIADDAPPHGDPEATEADHVVADHGALLALLLTL